MKSTFRALGSVGLATFAPTTTATVTALPPLQVANPNFASATFAVSRPSDNNAAAAAAARPRDLQAGTCSSDAVTLSVASNSTPESSSASNRFSPLAVCYQDTGLITSDLPYYTPSGLDLPYLYIGALDIDATASDSTSTFARWVLGDHDSGEQVCASNEPAETVHPGEATWFCRTDESGNELLSVSSECGGACEDSDPGETTCSSSTITVTSSAFPSFEGCYEPTGEEAVGQPVLSKTGQLVEGEPLILMSDLTEITGLEALIWNLGLLEGATVPILSCVSGPSTNTVHPADALWSCDIDGDSIVGWFPSETADTPGLFEVSCGGAATTCADATSSSATDETTSNPRGVTITSSGSGSDTDAPAPADDDGATSAEESIDVDDDDKLAEASEDEDEGEDEGSSNDGDTASTGGGVRLAASPTSPVGGVVVGLAMATAVGAFSAL